MAKKSERLAALRTMTEGTQAMFKKVEEREQADEASEARQLEVAALVLKEHVYGTPGLGLAKHGKGYATKVADDLWHWRVEIPGAGTDGYKIAFGVRGHAHSQGDALVYISNVMHGQNLSDMQIFVNR